MVSRLIIAAALACAGATASASTLQLSGYAYGNFKNLANADDDVILDEYYTHDGSDWVSNGRKTAVVWGHGPSTVGFWNTSFIGIRDIEFSCALTHGAQSCDIARLDWHNASPGPDTHDDDFDVRAVLSFGLTSPFVSEIEDEGFELNIQSGQNPGGPDSIFATAFNDYNIGAYDLGSGFAITGFSFRTEGAGSVVPQSSTEFLWTNDQQSISSLYVVAEISGPVAVPLPAAGWMLLAGLGGLAALRSPKRRKQQ